LPRQREPSSALRRAVAREELLGRRPKAGEGLLDRNEDAMNAQQRRWPVGAGFAATLDRRARSAVALRLMGHEQAPAPSASGREAHAECEPPA
jgi:hypothetical protein